MDQPLWSFELLGFRVQVWATFVLLSAFLAMFAGLAQPLLVLGFMVMVFVSIVVHELGHAFVARRFGLAVGNIQLRGMGGQVTHARTTHMNQLAISLAGPGAGLLLGAVLWGLTAVLPLPDSGSLRTLLMLAVSINLVWSLFNLLPVLPLDGGNALRAAMSMVMPEREAWKLAAISTMVLGVIGALFALQAGELFLPLFGAYFAYRGYQLYQQLV